MDLAKKNVTFVFIVTLVSFLVLPPLLHSLHIFYFAPFLVAIYYQYRLIASLWASLLCGLIVDIFSADVFFGINSLAYTVSTLLLYDRRRYFFSDRPTTLPLMTCFFSQLVTFIMFTTSYFFEKKIKISWDLFTTDFVLMPLADGLFAFVIFILPFQLFGAPKRKGMDYFRE